MGLLNTARKAARNLLETKEVAPVEDTTTDVDQLAAQLATAERKAEEYFQLIVRMEAQRDEWKEMFFRQSRAHGVAQNMLQNTLATRNQQIMICLRELNAYRDKIGLQPVRAPEDHLDPGEKVEEFKKLLELLEASVSKDIEGVVERDAIAKKYEAQEQQS